MTQAPNAYRVYGEALATSLRPRHRLRVSEWADKFRRLDPKGSAEPGPWRTDRNPLLREIMDALSDRSPVSEVVVMKPSQGGGTEVSLNWLGYIIDHAPAPALVVLPTIEVRRRWVRQRLDPLLASTPRLAAQFDVRRKRDTANSEDIKDFRGGLLVVGGANAPASLASMPIKHVICDEVDRFPWAAGQEGDPLRLIEQRQVTFRRKKLLLVSSPTIEGASRIAERYEASDRRRYVMPCPHCETEIEFRWPQLQWSAGAARAWYVCEHCGGVIEEREKTAMLAKGRWRPENPKAGDHVRGYTWNALYTPIGLGLTWAELARDWLTAQDDPTKLVTFINTKLAQTWQERSQTLKANALQRRAQSFPLRSVPEGVLLITVGMDTQDDRIAIQLLGWGRKERNWPLDWLEIPGDPESEELWQKVADYLQQPLVREDGAHFDIDCAAIDTAGHHTHAVYNFVRSRPIPRIMAVRGANAKGRPVISARPTLVDLDWRGKQIKRGVKLWAIGTDTAKHVLTQRLAADAERAEHDEDRHIHFSDDLPADYFEQITAEHFDPKTNRWKLKKGKRNEAMDTWVYGYAAAMHPDLRIHTLTDADWDRIAARRDADAARRKTAAPESPTPSSPEKPRPSFHPPRKKNRGFVKRYR